MLYWKQKLLHRRNRMERKADMASRSSARKPQKTVAKLVKFSKRRCEMENKRFAQNLQEKVYPAQDKIQRLERELTSYRQSDAKLDTEIQELTNESEMLLQHNRNLKQRLNIKKDLAEQSDTSDDEEIRKLLLKISEHETDLSVLKEHLQHVDDQLQKEKTIFEERLTAESRAAAQRKTKLQRACKKKTKILRAETRAAQDELKEFEVAENNARKQLEDLKREHDKKVRELKQEDTDLVAKERQLSRKTVKVELKLQNVESTLKKETRKRTELQDSVEKINSQIAAEEKKCKRCENGLRKEQDVSTSLENKISEKKQEMVNTVTDVTVETQVKVEEKEDEKKNRVGLIQEQLEYELNKSEMQAKSGRSEIREMKDSIRQTERESEHLIQEMNECVEAFKEACPHSAHSKDVRLGEVRKKFLSFKKKYVNECNTLSEADKEANVKRENILQGQLEEAKKITEEKMKELQELKRERAAEEEKNCQSLIERTNRMVGLASDVIEASEGQYSHRRSKAGNPQSKLKTPKEGRRDDATQKTT